METPVFSDRERSNILKKWESQWILFLCQKMPPWMTPNRLTLIGVLGSGVVMLGLWLGHLSRAFLLVSILGLAIQWFGDSLDGRLAYYRNIARKWYGFSLDILADWFSMFIITIGFYIYLPEYKLVAFVYLLGYGALMLISLLRYKINDSYSIDAFQLGPTEMRIILAILLIIEMFRANTLLQIAVVGAFVLAILVLVALRNLLKLADERDWQEKSLEA